MSDFPAITRAEQSVENPAARRARAYDRLMPTSARKTTPRPVLVRFSRVLARDVLAVKSAPWVFCKSRSGQEPGTQVLMYVAELRVVVGAYMAGTVFEYKSLAGLKAGINVSEIERFGRDDIDQGWMEEVFAWQSHGWAIDICNPRAFTPHLALSDTAIGEELTDPDGFQYLDLDNPEDARIWSRAQASNPS